MIRTRSIVQGRAAFGFGTGGVIGRIMRENPALFDKTGILEVLKDRPVRSGKLRLRSTTRCSSGNTARTYEQAKTFIRWFVQPGRLEPLYIGAPGQHWPIFKRDSRHRSREERTGC